MIHPTTTGPWAATIGRAATTGATRLTSGAAAMTGRATATGATAFTRAGRATTLAATAGTPMAGPYDGVPV